jgi:hypothetical protein
MVGHEDNHHREKEQLIAQLHLLFRSHFMKDERYAIA